MSRYYSPLRYPGGKGRLAPYFTDLMECNDLTGGHYVEPYAGGAGVALSLLINGAVRHVHLNDLNFPLYCLWDSILNETDALCRKIYNGKISVEAWKRHKRRVGSCDDYSKLDVAFSMLFLNRTNRSGIINGGMIGGYEQSGTWKMDARFYKKTITQRINKIAEHRENVSLYNLDAVVFLKGVISKLPKETLVYIDPPYYKNGQRLYDNYYKHEDHEQISKVVHQLKRSWVVSYDNVPEISSLYSSNRQLKYSLEYSAGKHYKGSELMIYSDNMVLPNPNNPTSKKNNSNI